MSKRVHNSIVFDNVYIKSCGTTCGLKEYIGPLGAYIDKHYDNQYAKEKSFEKAEIKMLLDAISICLAKGNVSEEDVHFYVGGDLNNQLAITNYALKELSIPTLGAYAACSTFTESMILASIYLSGKSGNNYVLCGSSSHNSTSERQFRNPTEYGGQKPTSFTSTVTGAGVCLLTNERGSIQVTKGTIGYVLDGDLKDSSDLGRAMAPACAETVLNHLTNFNETPSDYDLILTGDLSTYGTEVLYKMLDNHNINIRDKHKDSGLLIYNVNEQEVHSGGSGAGCIAITCLSYVVKMLNEKKLNKVLIVATGALMNPVMVAQKNSIPSIAHAIVLERVI